MGELIAKHPITKEQTGIGGDDKCGVYVCLEIGPINEAAVPLRKAIHVRNGWTSVTAAKEGFPYPVGTPIPEIGLE